MVTKKKGWGGGGAVILKGGSDPSAYCDSSVITVSDIITFLHCWDHHWNSKSDVNTILKRMIFLWIKIYNKKRRISIRLLDESQTQDWVKYHILHKESRIKRIAQIKQF